MTLDLSAAEEEVALPTPWRSQVGIPVRNLWLLLMYAADLAEFGERFDGLADESADLPELLGRLLAWIVERRLRQNLSRGYVQTSAVLRRVRGRIDWFKTETGLLLQRGEVACRFEEHTCDTPRNRLVRSALEAMAATVGNRQVAQRCARLARSLAEQGVGTPRPSRSEMARERFGRHDAHDKLMVVVANLALDLVLPSETAGDRSATRLQRDERLMRKIFERAVAGFYRAELDRGEGWSVFAQAELDWGVEETSEGFGKWLPGMNADLKIERRAVTGQVRRIIIDTKFADALTTNAFQQDVFRSGHLYQLYAYLRTQAGRGRPGADDASGILLYPVIDRNIDEWGMVQGQRLKIATVNLAVERIADLRARLLLIVSDPAVSP